MILQTSHEPLSTHSLQVASQPSFPLSFPSRRSLSESHPDRQTDREAETHYAAETDSLSVCVCSKRERRLTYAVPIASAAHQSLHLSAVKLPRELDDL